MRFSAARIENPFGKFSQRPRDLQFVFEQAYSGLCDDQVYAGHTGIGVEHAQNRLSQHGAGSSSDADDNDLSFG